MTSQSAALLLDELALQDLTPAAVLGYRRPADARRLIQRHMATLKAFGLVRQVAEPIVGGKRRAPLPSEDHLTKASVAFIVAKAGTKRADSLTAALAEVFAMVLEGKLIPADEDAVAELKALSTRARERQRGIEKEEWVSRSGAFASRCH